MSDAAARAPAGPAPYTPPPGFSGSPRRATGAPAGPPIGVGPTVYDARKDVIWAPDAVAATALDGQDGKYDGKYFGTKIKVMKKKNGVPQYPGNPAHYGYPQYANPKDPYIAAGVPPGTPVYDPYSNKILAPDAVTASALDGQDGTFDGTYHGTKIAVKKSKAPGYTPFYPFAKKQPVTPGYNIPGSTYGGYGGSMYGGPNPYGGAPYGGSAGGYRY